MGTQTQKERRYYYLDLEGVSTYSIKCRLEFTIEGRGKRRFNGSYSIICLLSKPFIWSPQCALPNIRSSMYIFGKYCRRIAHFHSPAQSYRWKFGTSPEM